MKKRTLLILSATGLLLGCSLEEVQSWGNVCPPLDADNYEELTLSYIGSPECRADNQGACDVSEMANKNIGLYFETKNCPPEYKICAKNDDGIGYHCEKDKTTVVVTECAQGQKLCKDENGNNFCLDPAFIKTCGAYDCEDKENNYGGKDCSEHDDLSRCEKNAEDKYVCKCPNGALLCNEQCINPNSSTTCGAYDCELENYGGQNCELGNAVCSKGKCTCLGSGIWCRLEGEDESAARCIEPQENATCNAQLLEDSDVCVISPCDEYQLCVLSGDNEYSCRQNSCISEEMLCKIDDTWQCISKLDKHNCGSCNIDCESKSESNAHGVSCVNDETGDFVCTYECEPGFTNCGTELHPKCVSLNTFQHCGECNKACLSYEFCNEGVCETTVCQENQCTLSGVTNGEVCVNNTEHCGKNCDNCLSIHPNATCLNGTCVISQCKEGEHPVFEGTQITRCVANTADVCGPAVMTLSDTLVNCLEEMPENAIERDCGLDGTCIVVDCEDNYHISSDEKSCESNTKTACGSGNAVVNCDDIQNSAETVCIASACYVSACATGYHLSEDHLSCVENTASSCAAVTSSEAVNCADVIGNAAMTACSAAGACEVTQCLSGFHLSADRLSCEANSPQVCAPTDSDRAVNCDEQKQNSVTTKCDAGLCSVSACADSYHIAQNECEANSDKFCGAVDSDQTVNCNDKISHSSKTECLSGVCSVKECADGYHASSDNKSCVQSSATKCAIDGGMEVNCNEHISNSAETSCESGKCKVLRCASDYHLSSNRESCIENTETKCAVPNSSDEVNCNNKILDSAETRCVSGECSVTKCASNYHLSSDKKSCVENTNTACAAVNSSNAMNCNDVISNSANTSCNNGECVVSNCLGGFHLTGDGKSCVSNTSEQCAATNSSDAKNCSSAILSSASTSCDEGICHVTDCKPGYHLSGNTACASNSDTACAATNSASPKDCNTFIEHSVMTACSSSGACTVSKCAALYHLNTAKTACELNSDTSCAPVDSSTTTDCTRISNASSASCSDAGKCVVSKCSGNYHISADKTSCEANSNTSCGSGTSVAPAGCITEGVAQASCPAGVCVVWNCNTGYHISSDGKTCEANSVTKCAATNSSSTVSCKTEGVATTSCSTGVCQVSACNSGYHISSDKKSCVANSNTSCASTTSSNAVNCTTLTNVVSASCNSQGACVVTECKSGNHIKSDKTACEANSNTSCATTTSNAPVSCMTTGVKTATCSGGACTASECNSGYHLNSGKTGCVANSDTSCASTTSNSPTNCTTIAHIASGAGKCTSSGACSVSSCASGYHLNSGKTGCDANSNTSCAGVSSNSPTNCTTIAHIASGAGTCSSSGACTVSSCASGYHLNSGKTGCDANSNTSCAGVSSNSPQNCTTIAHIASGAGTCSSSGACTVSSCASGYHLNSGKTGCDANSNTSCAGVSSNSPTNCTTIAHIASGAGTCTSSGACTVSKCASGYHLNSGKTGCVANSNTSCAPVNSNSPTNCTSGVQKVCNSSGKCACSTDGSTVLNYDGNACVHKACQGYPGVMAGTVKTTNYYSGGDDYRCYATSCASGYKLYESGSSATCRPLYASMSSCTGLGYRYNTNCSGYCSGQNSGCGSNGHGGCASGYREYRYACIESKYCCGTRSYGSDGKGYQCKNCVALGYTGCNESTGACI